MRLKDLCLMLFVVCCAVPFFSPSINAAIGEGVMRATHNGYTVASAAGVKSVRVVGERFAGDCSVQMHAAEVSECCAVTSVEFKAPDCSGEPRSVVQERGETVVAYGGGKSVRLKKHKGHVSVHYHRSHKATSRGHAVAVGGPGAASTVKSVPPPAASAVGDAPVPAPPKE